MSVEQKIREKAKELAKNSVLAYLQAESATKPKTILDANFSQNDAIEFFTQSILQIISSDVIGGDENPEGEPPYATISGYRADIEIVVAQSQNALRAEQRANLREDK